MFANLLLDLLRSRLLNLLAKLLLKLSLNLLLNLSLNLLIIDGANAMLRKAKQALKGYWHAGKICFILFWLLLIILSGHRGQVCQRSHVCPRQARVTIMSN